MAIVQTLSKSSFIESFKQSSRKDQFSYEALGAIFDYLEEYSDSTGEPVEFDIVEICCDYCEQSWQDIARDYDVDIDELDDDEAKQHVMNYLCDNTSVIGESNGCFVFQCF